MYPDMSFNLNSKYYQHQQLFPNSPSYPMKHSDSQYQLPSITEQSAFTSQPQEEWKISRRNDSELMLSHELVPDTYDNLHGLSSNSSVGMPMMNQPFQYQEFQSGINHPQPLVYDSQRNFHNRFYSSPSSFTQSPPPMLQSYNYNGNVYESKRLYIVY